jgi:hypothetical protein
MSIESELQKALARDPRAFGKALTRMGFAVDRSPQSRFRAELRKRFPSSTALLKALGMDSAMLGGPLEQRNRPINEEFAAHGHANHDADFDADDNGDWKEKARKFMSDCGLSEDDIGEVFSMMPHMGGEDEEPAEPDEAEVRRVLRERGESDATKQGRSGAAGPQQENQARLERAEREVSPRHERDAERARMTEHRNSTQSRDRMAGDSADEFAAMFVPRNGVNGVNGGIGTSMSGSLQRDLERAPISKRERERALALDGAVSDEFAEMFPEAMRIGFSL